MRNKNNKHLGIEIAPDVHANIKYISKYEGRSINGQIFYLVNQCICDFERENGIINSNDK